MTRCRPLSRPHGKWNHGRTRALLASQIEELLVETDLRHPRQRGERWFDAARQFFYGRTVRNTDAIDDIAVLVELKNNFAQAIEARVSDRRKRCALQRDLHFFLAVRSARQRDTAHTQSRR